MLDKSVLFVIWTPSKALCSTFVSFQFQEELDAKLNLPVGWSKYGPVSIGAVAQGVGNAREVTECAIGEQGCKGTQIRVATDEIGDRVSTLSKGRTGKGGSGKGSNLEMHWM